MSKYAFTLVELLVVIAIVGILTAMLIPSLASARETARTSICKSNMRQMGLGVNYYANNFQSRILIVSPGYGQANLCPTTPAHPAGDYCPRWTQRRYWHHQLAEALGFEDTFGQRDTFYLIPRDPRIFMCPSDIDRTFYGYRPGRRDDRGYDLRWSGRQGGYNGTYNYDTYHSSGPYAWNLNAGQQCSRTQMRFDSLKKSGSRIILFGDAQPPDGSPNILGSLRTPAVTGGPNYLTARHAGSGNYAYADGHVADKTQPAATIEYDAVWNSYDKASDFAPDRRTISTHFAVSSTD